MKTLIVNDEEISNVSEIETIVKQKLIDAGFDMDEAIYWHRHFEAERFIFWQDKRINTSKIKGLKRYESCQSWK